MSKGKMNKKTAAYGVALSATACLIVVSVALHVVTGQTPPTEKDTAMTVSTAPETEGPDPAARLEKATFGAGCFWCTEAV